MKKFNILQLKLSKIWNLYVYASIIGLEMLKFKLVLQIYSNVLLSNGIEIIENNNYLQWSCNNMNLVNDMNLAVTAMVLEILKICVILAFTAVVLKIYVILTVIVVVL